MICKVKDGYHERW